jgi:hypothetical protein
MHDLKHTEADEPNTVPAGPDLEGVEGQCAAEERGKVAGLRRGARVTVLAGAAPAHMPGPQTPR